MSQPCNNLYGGVLGRNMFNFLLNKVLTDVCLSASTGANALCFGLQGFDLEADCRRTLGFRDVEWLF